VYDIFGLPFHCGRIDAVISARANVQGGPSLSHWFSQGLGDTAGGQKAERSKYIHSDEDNELATASGPHCENTSLFSFFLLSADLCHCIRVLHGVMSF
jgi:hypothetical protein